jgi:hypothetical protein
VPQAVFFLAMDYHGELFKKSVQIGEIRGKE